MDLVGDHGGCDAAAGVLSALSERLGLLRDAVDAAVDDALLLKQQRAHGHVVERLGALGEAIDGGRQPETFSATRPACRDTATTYAGRFVEQEDEEDELDDKVERDPGERRREGGRGRREREGGRACA